MPTPRTESDSGTVPVDDGLFVHYVRHGDGAEALVVPSASWLGRDMGPLLEGRTVVFYDVRGRGRAAAIQDESLLGVQHDAADLEHLRRALSLERMSLLGWSYHGAIAAHYAARHPQRVERLLLVGPTAPVKNPFFEEFLVNFASRVDVAGLERLEEKRKRGLKTANPEAWCRAVHRLYLLAYVVDDTALERMQSSPCVEPNLDPDHVNNLGRRVIEIMGDYDWRPAFAAIQAPTLVLHGRQDPVPLAGSREWVRCIPDARMVVWDDVCHMPWLERPDLFFPCVERFLAGQWPAEAQGEGTAS